MFFLSSSNFGLNRTAQTDKIRQKNSKAVGFLFAKLEKSSILGVSENRGGPSKSSILTGVFHYFPHPFWGKNLPIFGNIHIRPLTYCFGTDLEVGIGSWSFNYLSFLENQERDMQHI